MLLEAWTGLLLQRSIQTEGFNRLGASSPANGNKAGCQNIQPVIFIHAVFSLLDFWTLEDRTNMSQNIGKELPLIAAHYLRRVQHSHDSLAMQALA